MKATVVLALADVAQCQHYRTILGQEGFEVHTASGGIECMEKLRSVLPDVLVLAAELPWGGAEGVLAELVEDPSLPWVPVLLLGEKGHSLGPAAWSTLCLSRPVPPATLIRSVWTCIQQNQSAPVDSSPGASKSPPWPISSL